MVDGITAVVLAATELGGMGDDYFENKTRHLIPLCNKPMISHLIDSLLCDTRIKKIFIVIEEKINNFQRFWPCCNTYQEVLKKEYKGIYKNKLELYGQNFLTRAGTFEAVRSFIKNKGERFPLLIVYGDTYVDPKFLSLIIDRYEKDESDQPKIYWGLTNNDVSKKGNVLLDYDKTKNADESYIREISELGIDTQNSLTDTGIMLLTKSSWESIIQTVKKIHRPSPLGIFSFANILRQTLIFKDIKKLDDETPNDLKIDTIIKKNSCYFNANRPWELIEFNKITHKRVIETNILSKIDNFKWIDLKDSENIDDLLGKEPIKIPKGTILRSDENIIIIGPCYFDIGVKIGRNCLIERSFIGLNSKINEGANILDSQIQDVRIGKSSLIKESIILNSIINENSIIKSTYIGDDCNISNNVSIEDSTLEKRINIGINNIIHSSIIMRKSTIFHNSLISMSIIGKHVTIGVGVTVPCSRLNIDEKVTFFSDIDIAKTNKFGAIIGDYCQIGSGSIIHPGRKVGKNCNVDSNLEVINNLPPRTKLRNSRGYAIEE